MSEKEKLHEYTKLADIHEENQSLLLAEIADNTAHGDLAKMNEFLLSENERAKIEMRILWDVIKQSADMEKQALVLVTALAQRWED